MSFEQWDTPIDHTSDATFRTWASELHAKLTAAGRLVNTNDTGQVDLGTMTRPGLNGYAGYKIYRFNDSLQATTPIFIKIEFGTAGNAASPALRFTVGSGTDGAGNVSSPNTGAVAHYASDTFIPGTTAYKSYVSCSEGFFGLSYKVASTLGGTSPRIYMFVERTQNPETGTPTADGWKILYAGPTPAGNNGSAAQGRTQNAESYISGTKRGPVTNGNNIVGYSALGSSSGGNIIVHRCHSAAPDIQPFLGVASYVGAAMPQGTEFDIALIGDDERHYIALGNGSGPSDFASNGNALFGYVMLWE